MEKVYMCDMTLLLMMISLGHDIELIVDRKDHEQLQRAIQMTEHFLCLSRI